MRKTAMPRLISVMIALLLATACVFGFAGCKSETQTDHSFDRDVKFYENGYSDYKIVLGENATAEEVYAADELNYFFNDATGYEFDVIRDSGLYHAKNNKYISIGKTNLLDTSGIYVDSWELGTFGYIVKTVDNTIYLTGAIEDLYEGPNKGSIFAVYDFLNLTLGYKYYAKDCFVINRDVSTLYLLRAERKEIPAISAFSLGYGSLQDVSYATRMRVKPYTEQGPYIYGGHTQQDLLHPSLYAADHPDWYWNYKPGDQAMTLCYSAPDLPAFFAELLKPRIAEIDSRIIHLGQPDYNTICECDRCKKERELYYGSSCGQQINFANKVAEALEPWLKENFPERKFLFSTYAYHYTEEPPVKWSEEENKYVPYSDQLEIRDDFVIYFAPIEMDWSKPIDDPDSKNTTSMNNLKKWHDLLGDGRIYLWSYSANFSNYFVSLDNIGNYARNFQVYAEYGVPWLYENTTTDVNSPTFEELRVFLESSLLWNPYQDVNALIDEFFQNYYGLAAEQMRRYYDELHAYYAYLESDDALGFMMGELYFNISAKEFWPKGILDNFNRIFEEAFEALEPLASTPEEYTKYYDRVRKIKLTTDYLILLHYQDNYVVDELIEMIDEFDYYTNRFGTLQGQEGKPIQDNITEWRNNLR